MRDRATVAGGELTVVPRPEGGTRMSLWQAARLSSVVRTPYGPFVEAPEYVGGFWVIEAADDATALHRIALIREGGMKALATPTVERWFSADFLAVNPAVREQISSAIA